jgi:hypothetical protein
MLSGVAHSRLTPPEKHTMPYYVKSSIFIANNRLTGAKRQKPTQYAKHIMQFHLYRVICAYMLISAYSLYTELIRLAVIHLERGLRIDLYARMTGRPCAETIKCI